jgi:AcrR family transcriptional regulator
VTKAARSGRDTEPILRVRQRLALAAVELFETRGYVETTIDDIAGRAGVGRRTFFRYYRSKEHVVFPDHDQLLHDVRARLSMYPDEGAMAAITEAVKIVLAHYVETKEISLLRYRLVKNVAPLREREIISVARYQRTFRERLAEDADITLESSMHAEVVAAAIVAAHNQVLRRWLRSDGATDPFSELDAALRYISEIFDRTLPDAGSKARGNEVIVLAFDSLTPTAVVVAELTKARSNTALITPSVRRAGRKLSV